MNVQVALLRGINVGGNCKVSMADLRDLFESRGLAPVKTLLQSGNVVFNAGDRNPTALVRDLENEAGRRFKAQIDFIIRTAEEWFATVSDNPFPDEATHDPGHLVALFLKESPPAENVQALREAIRGREYFTLKGRIAWVVYPDGIGRSKLTHSVVESRLGTRATGRNWNTVLKIADLCRNLKTHS